MQQCLMKIPYVNLADQHVTIKKQLLSAVEEVLESGKFILGEKVEAFEGRFAGLCGVKYALGVGSGTDALILALRALGIGLNDEVITTANGFVTCVSSIISVGAKPVFVDVCDDYTVDPTMIERAVTKNTKAVLVVHLTGKAADMDPILKIAEKYQLKVIEDCAQAVSAEYKGQKVGSFGDIGCFSLHPLKTLNACGDGGVVTTNSEQLYDALKIFRDNGMPTRDEAVVWSGNSRLDEVQAAILLVKLDYLEEWTEKRREHARYYAEQLFSCKDVQMPKEHANERAVYHTFVIRAQNRDQLRNYLEECGVGTKIHYPIPIHLQAVGQSLGYKQEALPITEKQATQILSLPVYQELKKEQLDYTVQCIKEFYHKKGK